MKSVLQLYFTTVVFLFGLAAPNWGIGQTVQWADNVLDVSSELGAFQYSGNQALGKPNSLPQGGLAPTIWIPAKASGVSFIKVGFENPMQIRQIAIAESYNPSAVVTVYAYDTDYNEYRIADFEPKILKDSVRMLNVFLDKTEYKVRAVGVVLDNRAIPGYVGIDAIGISDSKKPVIAPVNDDPSINPNLTPERLSNRINSKYPELKPLISPDGKTMYFSRQNHPDNIGGEDDKEDIWYADRGEDGNWKEAKNMGRPLNNEGPNFISSLTPDGQNMVVLLGNVYKGRDNDKMKSGVSMSRKTSDGWSEPEEIDIPKMKNFNNQANFFMANNQKVMLMSVEMSDSKGGRDLYASFKQDDGEWTEPVHLGDDVNTAGEESAPFLAADDRTLYFTSDGFSGYGQSDIYVSHRMDSTWKNWSEPENLGPDVNGPNNDEFFNIPPAGDYIYYSKGTTAGNPDIYRFPLPDFFRPAPVVLVYGKVFNAQTNEPIEAEIYYEKLPSGEDVGISRSDPKTGEYQIALPSGANYGYLAQSDEFISISQNLDLLDLEEYQEVKQNLYLVPIEKGAVVTLNNIFFDFDKATLRPSSYPELNRIVNLMRDNQDMKIKIKGHTDAIGSDNYNEELSQKRVQSVVDYLIENGISKERLESEGYGEEKPVATNQTPSGRQLNRRVEFSIEER